VRLLRCYHSAGKQEAVEGHGLDTIPPDGPITGQVRPNVVGRTEVRSSNEGEITAGTKGTASRETASREDGPVEVLEGVMTSTCTSPLKDDGEVRAGSGSVNDLSDVVDGARLERDMLNTSILEPVDDFNSLLSSGNANGNAEVFDRKTLLHHLLPERNLESDLPRVDVKGVKSDTNSSRDPGLNFGNLASEGGGIITPTARKLDVISGVEYGAYESTLDGRRRHTGYHDGRFAG
jgi:hypothetical protein